jgi:ArsR family transcriptional regulator
MRDLANIFSALADPTRLEMLALLLRNRELCVCDFVETLSITQSKASRHLRYMWNAGLLEDRRAGLWVYYRISPSMDAQRRVLTKALERMLRERDLTELEGKLEAWVVRKRGSNACAAPPHGTLRARAPGARNTPLSAAEARR